MSIKSCFFLFPCLLVFHAPAQGAGVDDADERLFKVQSAMAQKGNTRAQYYLGEMHEQGLGTKQDIDEAFKWYTKAAEQGDPMAKRKLAHRHEILEEIKKEREIILPPAPTPPAAPARKTGAKNKEPVAQATLAKSEPPAPDPAKALAEREKRRAAIRAMIMERMRNPTGELFGE